MLDPAQQETFGSASRAKLEFDLAQIEHLLEMGRVPPALADAREGLRRVLSGFGNEGQPGSPRPLTAAERQLIGPVYNRVIYRPPEEAIAARAQSQASTQARSSGVTGRPRLRSSSWTTC